MCAVVAEQRSQGESSDIGELFLHVIWIHHKSNWSFQNAYEACWQCVLFEFILVIFHVVRIIMCGYLSRRSMVNYGIRDYNIYTDANH